MERQFTRQAEECPQTLAKKDNKIPQKPVNGHGYIGTEHLLAGLLKELLCEKGTAEKSFSKNVGCEEFNTKRRKNSGNLSAASGYTGSGATVGRINMLTETKDPQYSPRARRIIEQAKEDAESVWNVFDGTEHLLLSLIREQRDRLRSQPD